MRPSLQSSQKSVKGCLRRIASWHSAYLLHVDHHKAFNLRIFLLVEAAVCQGHGCVFALSRQTADVDCALVNFRGVR